MGKQIKSATGLEFVRGGKQPLAYDIRIINGATDQNQIIPFKYDGTPESPWQRYLNSLHNTWHPVEISMAQDIELFKSGGLTESEERLFRWNLSYLVSADSLVANNFILGVYSHITSPESRQYYMRQIFEEALHCYVEGTEVLTTEGWIKFEDLTGDPNVDPKVAQYHENGDITFVKYGEYVCDPYEGDVYEFKNKRGTFNKVVTPEHRCVSITLNNNKLNIVKAEDLKTNGRNFKSSGLLVNKFKTKKFCDIDRLFVAFQADGSLFHKLNKNTGDISGEIGIQFFLKKERKIERLLKIVENIGLRYTIKNCGVRNGYKYIYIWVDRKYSKFLTKDFSWVILDDINGKWIDLFIEELSYWDGCRRNTGSICYTNTNKKAIEKVQILTHISGKRAGFYSKESKGNHRKSYQLHIHNHSYVSGKTITKTKQSYKGNVYCVSVPTGMLMVRYKGAIMISGNTHSYQHIVESLGLDDEANAMFNSYREIDSIADKAEWNLNFTNALANKEVIAGTEQANRLLIDDLIAYIVFESLFFWCAFS
ncbi:ribonucleotide-diphosphate reductase subunit beta, partial [Candidatus Woesearchaeota archaeon]|nr:ribonucleotide-diphosphate reductase subunit beta [Candidatus Woesearchaeota archaeon]